MPRQKKSMWFMLCVCVLWSGLRPGSAEAAYILTAKSAGASSALVTRGNSFDLDIALTSGAADQSNSAVFRIVFSDPGLVLNSYTWKAPYTNPLPVDDGSTPKLTALPVTLTSSTYATPGEPGTIDINLDHVLSSGKFTSGPLLTLTLTVPANYSGPGTISITPVPDTFADGFATVTTTGGPAFVLAVPEPSSLGVLLLVSVAALRRRR